MVERVEKRKVCFKNRFLFLFFDEHIFSDTQEKILNLKVF